MDAVFSIRAERPSRLRVSSHRNPARASGRYIGNVGVDRGVPLMIQPG